MTRKEEERRMSSKEKDARREREKSELSSEE